MTCAFLLHTFELSEKQFWPRKTTISSNLIDQLKVLRNLLTSSTLIIDIRCTWNVSFFYYEIQYDIRHRVGYSVSIVLESIMLKCYFKFHEQICTSVIYFKKLDFLTIKKGTFPNECCKLFQRSNTTSPFSIFKKLLFFKTF